ncbi:coiled-coil domain-containing protein [Haloarcula halophila]|uniref:hypothetical protein n=1 Tax=Haloarcula TaxID=2237 RepID=UPI0023E3F1FB|nr:hypothetical protein [Halomicroarcula sp. DFY41]
MVSGFYGALAASASVFIGILTALLASNLSNLNAQRERIDRRIGTIDSRLENLNKQYEHFRDTIEEIREQQQAEQRCEQAEEEVDNFIEEHIRVEFTADPDELTPRMLQRELADYLDVDRLNEEQHNVLQERYEDIQSALTTTSSYGGDIPDDAFIDAEVMAINNQIDHQWQIHTEQRYNRNYRRWVQTMTEIRSLQDERSRLADRHESLDPSRIRGSLRATVVTIGLSVGIPLLFYFFRVAELSFANFPPWVEPTLVSLLWVGGLLHVFSHLRDQVNEETGDLPDEPDVSLDDDTTDL